jgi:hypothetical protein
MTWHFAIHEDLEKISERTRAVFAQLHAFCDEGAQSIILKCSDVWSVPTQGAEMMLTIQRLSNS